MITSRLTAFTFAALLSSVAFAASTSGTDPRVQGNDTGRQGGMNTPDSTAPDNAETGVGSKTTTGGSGSEGGAASQ